MRAARRIGARGQRRELLLLPRLLAGGEGRGDRAGCGGDIHHAPSFARGRRHPAWLREVVAQTSQSPGIGRSAKSLCQACLPRERLPRRARTSSHEQRPQRPVRFGRPRHRDRCAAQGDRRHRRPEVHARRPRKLTLKLGGRLHSTMLSTERLFSAKRFNVTCGTNNAVSVPITKLLARGSRFWTRTATSADLPPLAQHLRQGGLVPRPGRPVDRLLRRPQPWPQPAPRHQRLALRILPRRAPGAAAPGTRSGPRGCAARSRGRRRCGSRCAPRSPARRGRGARARYSHFADFHR